MNIKTLSDSALLSQTREVARAEQRLALQLIEHLIEVDARKLYATLRYDSLFWYIVKDLGYSETTAYERLRAMNLVRRVPEAREKLGSGALNLSTAARVESFRKQEELSSQQTVALMEEVSYKSKRELEGVLLAKAPDFIPKENVRQVTETIQAAKLILDPKLQALIRRHEELHGKRPLSEVLADLLEAHLDRHDPLRKNTTPAAKRGATTTGIPASKPTAKQQTAPTAERDTAPTAKQDSTHTGNQGSTPTVKRSGKPPARNSRYVRADVEARLWERSQGRCEWRDPKTGQRCESRYRLQKDHYPIPFAMGGPTTFENLRLTCRAHNARFGVESFGKDFMMAAGVVEAG